MCVLRLCFLSTFSHFLRGHGLIALEYIFFCRGHPHSPHIIDQFLFEKISRLEGHSLHIEYLSFARESCSGVGLNEVTHAFNISFMFITIV